MYRRLPNGVETAIRVVPGCGVAHVFVRVEAGGMHEPAGAAHMLEHLLLRDLDVPGGGASNAYTGRERTCYFAHCLAEDGRRLVAALAERLTAPRLGHGAFRKEREVVLRELARRKGRRDLATYDTAMARHYDGGIGRRVLGTEASLRAMTLRDCYDFHRAHYGTMQVALCGEVDASWLEPFERATGRGAPAPMCCLPEQRWPRARTSPREVERPVKVDAAGEGDHLMVSFVREHSVRQERPVPCAEIPKCLLLSHVDPASPNVAWGELLRRLLVDGSDSRFFRRLRSEAGLSYSVRAVASVVPAFRGRNEGRVVWADRLDVHLTVESSRTEEAIGLVADLAHELRTGSRPVTEAEMRRALLGFRREWVDTRNDMGAWTRAVTDVARSWFQTTVDALSRAPPAEPSASAVDHLVRAWFQTARTEVYAA